MPDSYLKSQQPLLRRLPRELQAEVTMGEKENSIYHPIIGWTCAQNLQSTSVNKTGECCLI